MLAISLLVASLFADPPQTRSEIVQRYGVLDEDFKPSRNFLVRFNLNEFGINKIAYINENMYSSLYIALYDIKARGLLDEIHTFHGVYNPRGVRGQVHRFSMHSYGLAIDIKPFKKGFSKEFIKIFEDNGFCWGGNFGKPDRMHFSWGNAECPAKRKVKK